LIAIKGIPASQDAPNSINAVIEALKEATHLGVDIQLKILQMLPTLVENYGYEMNSDQIKDVLLLCSILQGANKNSVVINTASATLQQLIISIFDRVAREDKSTVAPPKTFEVPVNSGDQEQKILVSPVVYDCLMIFYDLCNLTENRKPAFLKFSHLPETFGLELLESIMTNHSEIFLHHVEFAYVLRTRVVPLLLRAFSEKREFSVTVRVTRILYLLIRRQLSVLKVECEVILSLLTHMLDPEAAPYWKRLLCMEVFQGVFSEFSLIQDIYQEYDAQEGRRAVLKCLLAAFDKISCERPEVIGTGPISSPFLLAETDESYDNEYPNMVGISLKSSVARVPCIDLLDKSDPPVVPDSYLYYLVLLCINSLSEGLTRQVISPHSDLEIPTQLVQQCWTEVLSCYGTFFHATVDMELYHALVRSTQKFAHSAGVLGLSTPRDAIMSLLAQFSILVDISEPTKPKSPGVGKNLLSVETIVGTLGSIREHQRTPSISGASATSQSTSNGAVAAPGSRNLSPRNILCFRALLNLAQTLGPSLGDSWKIVIETLQTCDALVNGVGKKRTRAVKGAQVFSQLGTDFNAVDGSFRRLLESSKEYSDSAFIDLTNSLCKLSAFALGLERPESSTQADPFFLIDLIGDLGQINMIRLVSQDSQEWNRMPDYLLRVIGTRSLDTDARARAGGVLNGLILRSSVECASSPLSRPNPAQRQILQSLRAEVSQVVKVNDPEDSLNIGAAESDIHVSAIDTLNKVLDQCGSKLVDGWDIVFEIINTVFEETPTRQKSDRLPRLIKSGFESLNLICNDFLAVLPEKCLMNLVNTLSKFCHQGRDLNISFASISFFWTVSDHLRNMLADCLSKDLPDAITDECELSNLASNGQFPSNVHALWIMSLLHLAKTAYDPRPQVRNGAIQILFRILDSHGSELPANVWKTCQSVVTPTIMGVKPDGSQDQPQGTETMSLILNGYSNLYSTFLPIFIKQEQDFIFLWNRLMDYLASLIDVDSPQLAFWVYSALEGILATLIKGNIQIPHDCVLRAWEFWSCQPVPSHPSDVKPAQEALTALVQLHAPLYQLSREVSDDNIQQSVALLGRCASFRFLPQFYSDKDHMSPLQAQSLDRIEAIEFKSLHAAGLILSLVANLSVLAFRDEQDDDVGVSSKEPTFLSLSMNSLQLLDRTLNRVFDTVDLKELSDDVVVKDILSKLLVPMEKKFDCPLISSREGGLELWQLATNTFLLIAERLIPVLEVSGAPDLWQLILRCGIAITSNSPQSLLQYEENYEKFDIDSYLRFIKLIEESGTDDCEFWQQLVKSLFRSSVLYLRGRYDEQYYSSSQPATAVQRLSQGPFYGSTEPVTSRSRLSLAYLCIDELFRLSAVSEDTDANRVIQKAALEFLVWRIALVLHQYVCDHALRGLAPMPKIARIELIHILTALEKYGQSSSSFNASLAQLSPLLARSIPISIHDGQVLKLLQRLLLYLAEH
jgi:hypothetical protein